jgi:hypothetical protein
VRSTGTETFPRPDLAKASVLPDSADAVELLQDGGPGANREHPIAVRRVVAATERLGDGLQHRVDALIVRPPEAQPLGFIDGMGHSDLNEHRTAVMGAGDIDAVGTDNHLLPGVGQSPGLGRSHQSGLAKSSIIELMGLPDLQGWNQDRPLPDDQLFRRPVQDAFCRAGASRAGRMRKVPGPHIPLAGDQHLPALRTAALARLAAADLLDRH